MDLGLLKKGNGDEGTFSRNVGIRFTNDAASYPRTKETSLVSCVADQINTIFTFR